MNKDYFTQFEPELQQLASLLQAKQLMLVTAESCTGGLIAAACTSLAGSSQWFSHTIVSYSNQAKQDLLQVPEALIKQNGAVSEPVAQAMLSSFRLQNNLVAIAVSGIAGPTGATKDKPVGTVCFAFAYQGQITSCTQYFTGNRQQVRQASLSFAIKQLIAILQKSVKIGTNTY